MHVWETNGSTSSQTYTAFGLTISSCIALPELLKGAGSPDVRIAYGAVPEALAGAVRKGVRYEAAPGKLLLIVDGVARFLVREGKEIVVERHTDVHDDDIRLFLLGSVFGALLHQRGVLALSASAVDIGTGGVVFLGKHGVGKSTLAAAFHANGYSVLADDLCAVSFREDGVPMVIPAFPQVKLWPDALERLSLDATLLPRVRPALEKRALPLEEGFAAKPRPLTRLYVLEGSNNATLRLTPVPGIARFKTLMLLTYRSQFLEGLGVGASHFKCVASLAMRFPMIGASRSTTPPMLDELVALIEGDCHV